VEVRPDYKIRFEGLPESFLGCPAFYGLDVQLSKKKSSNKPWSATDYYDDEAVELVQMYCAGDFLFGGYPTDVPWE